MIASWQENNSQEQFSLKTNCKLAARLIYTTKSVRKVHMKLDKNGRQSCSDQCPRENTQRKKENTFAEICHEKWAIWTTYWAPQVWETFWLVGRPLGLIGELWEAWTPLLRSMQTLTCPQVRAERRLGYSSLRFPTTVSMHVPAWARQTLQPCLFDFTVPYCEEQQLPWRGESSAMELRDDFDLRPHLGMATSAVADACMCTSLLEILTSDRALTATAHPPCMPRAYMSTAFLDMWFHNEWLGEADKNDQLLGTKETQIQGSSYLWWSHR